MITIRWKIFALHETASLSVTCTWEMVRKGFRAGEEETFCRMVAPNGAVPFLVSECTGYTDRRAPDASSGRRIGFVSAEPSRERVEVEIVPVSSLLADTE
jgi:hypothetical protein